MIQIDLVCTNNFCRFLHWIFAVNKIINTKWIFYFLYHFWFKFLLLFKVVTLISRNKTYETMVFYLHIQCPFLLRHVESWAVSSVIERVIGSGRWGKVKEGEGRKPSWFIGKKTPRTFSHKIKPNSSIGARNCQQQARYFFWSANRPKNHSFPEHWSFTTEPKYSEMFGSNW